MECWRTKLFAVVAVENTGDTMFMGSVGYSLEKNGVYVSDGVFQLHSAHCSLELSAGRWEGSGLFILFSPGDREGRG